MDKFELIFEKIKEIAGCEIDHSFPTYKKELKDYGYQEKKISMKGQKVIFEKETM